MPHGCPGSAHDAEVEIDTRVVGPEPDTVSGFHQLSHEGAALSLEDLDHTPDDLSLSTARYYLDEVAREGATQGIAEYGNVAIFLEKESAPTTGYIDDAAYPSSPGCGFWQLFLFFLTHGATIAKRCGNTAFLLESFLC